MIDVSKYEQVVSLPGKFEGCEAYVPYYWDMYLDGSGYSYTDEDDCFVTEFNITSAERQAFSIDSAYTMVKLWEDSYGFVYADLRES